MLGSKSLENRIQYRFQKAAEAVLIENDIGPSGVSSETMSVFQVYRTRTRLSRPSSVSTTAPTEELMSCIVGTVCRTCIEQIRRERHLQADHRNANFASSNKCLSSWLDDASDF